MISEYDIPFVYTVETSLGIYRDYLNQKDCFFNGKKWQQTGEQVVMALKEYYEGVEQYELFLEARRNMKKAVAQELRVSVTGSPKCSQRKPAILHKDPKDMKMFQIYEQIKELEEVKVKQEREDKE